MKNNELLNLTISQARQLMLDNEVSPVELTKAHLEKAQEIEHLNAYVLLTEDSAIKQSLESEKK